MIYHQDCMDYYDQAAVAGEYDMPVLEPVDFVPKKLIGFNYARSVAPDPETAIHFFLDDYQFERVWNRPLENINVLRKFGAVCTPDFSAFTDMPRALRIWNCWRSKMVGQMWQKCGLTVIPSMCWDDEQSYGYSFAGMPRKSTVVVSTRGCCVDKESKTLFERGYSEMKQTLQPQRVLLYGTDITGESGMFTNECVINYKAFQFSKKTE